MLVVTTLRLSLSLGASALERHLHTRLGGFLFLGLVLGFCFNAHHRQVNAPLSPVEFEDAHLDLFVDLYQF